MYVCMYVCMYIYGRLICYHLSSNQPTDPWHARVQQNPQAHRAKATTQATSDPKAAKQKWKTR